MTKPSEHKGLAEELEKLASEFKRLDGIVDTQLCSSKIKEAATAIRELVNFIDETIDRADIVLKFGCADKWHEGRALIAKYSSQDTGSAG